ncbi:PREDICTED: plexin-C1-like [Cyprinodon variegatus]|uniref:plexin-C1-like n=1 Tax=Cyprinodon variegatus TaxID=28743 RepID=UPI0007427D6B|nr:PREDICTED: plexin-C1-like [Cyprinodon variegatus]
MSSVLAVRLNGWMVFFIGTTDGQLIKLAVDRNYQPACPKILYRTNGDNRVFPKIHLDPVDQKHVYVAFKNQVKHVSVSNCGAHQNVKDCLSAQDPFCVWCLTEGRCKFEGDCKDGEWFSIPDESKQKIVSHIVMQDSTGAIKLIIQTHLTLKQTVQSTFACHFSSSIQLCKETGPPPQYPRCTCILKDFLPTDELDVNLKIRLGGTILADQIKISNCLSITGEASFHLCQRCIRAGCGWRQNRCSWGSDPIQKESICENMEFRKNFFKPEIFSISPSFVSFYGRNHVVLSGHNLRDVTRVRIQDNMGCDTKESPVLSNNGSSLTFHIPSTEKKGMFKVCVLLPDGSCHGHLTITYQSSPICRDIVPPSTWRSGKRMVTLIGTNLHLVEGITHNYTQQKVIPLRRSNFQSLIYETPAETNAGMLRSPVFLKVANQSLKCKKEIIYYPDPKFTSYTAVREGKDIRITIQKEPDKLEMKPEELEVWVIQGEKQHQCIEISKKSSNETESFICEMEGLQNFNQIKIRYGGKTINLWELSFLHQILLIIRLLLIPCIIAVLVKICWWNKRFTAETNHL